MGKPGLVHDRGQVPSVRRYVIHFCSVTPCGENILVLVAGELGVEDLFEGLRLLSDSHARFL